MSDPALVASASNSALKDKLTRLLYGENRQNLQEQEALAIGDTVLNRPMYRGFADNPMDVLTPEHYSPFNPADPNYSTIMEFSPKDPLWQQYVSYAEKILDPKRKRSDYTHYFAGKAPKWATAMEGLTKIGSHYFGREPRRKKATTSGGAGVTVKGK